jgi:hypothetical protein
MLNHVEFTIPHGTLTDAYCRDLDQFVCGILGWGPGRNLSLPNPTKGGMEFARWYDINDSQYVVLHEDDKCMQMGTDDHFGWKLNSFKRLDDVLEQCLALQRRDDRMSFLHVIDGRPSSMEHEGNLFGGFYVKYLLPVYIDLNVIEPIN